MELKGKPLSLGAKILAVVIAVGALAVKAFLSPELDIDAALKVAGFCVVVFGTVDVSMIIGNITGLRNIKDDASGHDGGGK
jgi:hypothetical protein